MCFDEFGEKMTKKTIARFTPEFQHDPAQLVVDENYWSTDKLHNTESIHSEKRRELQVEMFKQCFIWLKNSIDINLNEKWSVLEAGQGKYGFSSLYREYFETVYGADLEDYSKYHPGVKSIKADFCKKLPLDDKSLNLIVSHSVLEHVKDVYAALLNFDRVLKVGGYMFITISPLYYSATGSHVNHPEKLTNWDHLNPKSPYYNLNNPLDSAVTDGHYLNKMTFSDFIGMVGKLPYSIISCKLKIDGKEVPSYVSPPSILETDLRARGFFILLKKEWHNYYAES